MFSHLKIKHVIILIAALGIFFGLAGLRRRSRTFERLAQWHAVMIQSLGDSNLPYSKHAWLTGKSSLGRKELAAFEREREAQIHYHEAMYKKYKYAASRPWLSVDPDPPPPR